MWPLMFLAASAPHLSRLLTLPAVRRNLPIGTPRDLAWIRIVVCSILIAAALSESPASVAEIPPELRRDLGLYSVLKEAWGLEDAFRDPTVLTSLKWGTVGLLAAGAVGLLTRVSLPLAAVAYFALGGVQREYCHFYHECFAPLYVLAVLCFLPAGRAWSADARLGLVEPEPADERSAERYGWYRFYCWCVPASVYFCAALSKLQNGGAFWWDPLNVRLYIYADSLDEAMQFRWGFGLRLLEAPDVVPAAIGLSGLLFELIYPLVLVSRPARRILPSLGVGLHLGILLLQNVLFFDMFLLPLIFVPATAVAATASRFSPVRPSRPAPGPSRPAPGPSRPAPGPSAARLPSPASEHSPARYRRTAAALLTALIGFAALGIDYYPFTGWAMYSRRHTEPFVPYWRVVGTTADGRRVPVFLGRHSPILTATRHRRHFRAAIFDPAARPHVETLLRSCLERHNREAAPHDRLAAVEVQLWRWMVLGGAGPERARFVEKVAVALDAPPPDGSVAAAR